MGIVSRNVRRVRHNESKALTGKRRVPVPLVQLHSSPQAPSVVTGDIQRSGRQIDRTDDARRAFQRQRNGDNAGPRSQIHQPRPGRLPCQSRQRQFNQQLGFRARHQHCRRDLKQTPTEFRLTEQIGYRLARGTPRHPIHELRQRRRRQPGFRPGQQVDMCAAAGLLQEQSGVQPINPAPRPGERLAQGHAPPCSASSAS